jgi:hypothetical protein
MNTNTVIFQPASSPRRQGWPLFCLGPVFGTPGAVEAMAAAGDDAKTFLRRHSWGDWGDVCAEDSAANERALDEGTRIFSVYHTSADVKLWVITEADRSSTTILLPSEY